MGQDNSSVKGESHDEAGAETGESARFNKPDPNPKGKCCRTGCPDCPWNYAGSGVDPDYPAELQGNPDEAWD